MIIWNERKKWKKKELIEQIHSDPLDPMQPDRLKGFKQENRIGERPSCHALLPPTVYRHWLRERCLKASFAKELGSGIDR